MICAILPPIYTFYTEKILHQAKKERKIPTLHATEMIHLFEQ